MLDHRYVVRRHDDRLQPALLIAMLGNNLQRVPSASAISHLGSQVRYALHTFAKRTYIYEPRNRFATFGAHDVPADRVHKVICLAVLGKYLRYLRRHIDPLDLEGVEMQKEGRIVDGAYGIDNAELFILFDQIAVVNDISSQQHHDPKRKDTKTPTATNEILSDMTSDLEYSANRR